MPTSWPITPPWSKQPPPSRSGPVFCIAIFAWLTLSQLVNLIQWDEFMGLPAYTRFFWLIFDMLMLLGFVGSYTRSVEQRRKDRRDRFMSTDWPELEPATDWQEIERAMGDLLANGTDPTFERAKDWLRREAEQKRYIEMVDKKIELSPHPYGTTPEGLIDEVRVEMEKDYRENNYGFMPSAAQRCRDAEVIARERWPEYFDDVIDR